MTSIKNNQTLNYNTIFENTFHAYICSPNFSKLTIKEREYIVALYQHLQKVLIYETTIEEFDSKKEVLIWLSIIFDGAKKSRFYRELSSFDRICIEKTIEQIKQIG